MSFRAGLFLVTAFLLIYGVRFVDAALFGLVMVGVSVGVDWWLDRR